MVVYPRYLSGYLVGDGESCVLFVGFICIYLPIFCSRTTIFLLKYLKNENNIDTTND